MVRWCGGAVVRWCGGAVVRWCGGAVVRWCGGAVVRWCGSAVVQLLACWISDLKVGGSKAWPLLSHCFLGHETLLHILFLSLPRARLFKS